MAALYRHRTQMHEAVSVIIDPLCAKVRNSAFLRTRHFGAKCLVLRQIPPARYPYWRMRDLALLDDIIELNDLPRLVSLAGHGKPPAGSGTGNTVLAESSKPGRLNLPLE